jgi:hypothetical protein
MRWQLSFFLMHSSLVVAAKPMLTHTPSALTPPLPPTPDPPTPQQGCSASPLDEGADLFTWNATILGPCDTPFDGGIFSLKLSFTESYPSRPPRVRFTSEM